MTVTAPLLTLAMLHGPSASGNGSPPIPLALGAVSADVLHDCDAADLENTLKGGLRRGKLYRLVSGPEDASMSLEIVECSRLDQHKQTFTSKGGRVKVPVGHGVASGSEQEIGIQSESSQSVILRARVLAGSRFVDVASGPKDRNLRQATDTLRRAIDKALRERGPWLRAARP